MNSSSDALNDLGTARKIIFVIIGSGYSLLSDGLNHDLDQ